MPARHVRLAGSCILTLSIIGRTQPNPVITMKIESNPHTVIPALSRNPYLQLMDSRFRGSDGVEVQLSFSPSYVAGARP